MRDHDTTDKISENSVVPPIGRLIRDELARQERTVAWFARKIHCDRRNVYNIFERDFIDTGLLLKISDILHTDFFRLYSEALINTWESSSCHHQFPESHKCTT